MKSIRACVAAAALLSISVTSARVEAKVHLPVPYMAQPDGQTCFPTSFMMALNFMGRIDEFSSATVQELHKYCQYDRFNAPSIAQKFGMYALPNWHNLGWTKDTVKYELDHGRPVILGVNQGRSGHFILAVGYTDDDKLIVNDPSQAAWGYGLGGEGKAVEWDQIIWRGGVILRPDPFPEGPALSGVAVDRRGGPLESTIDLMLTSGEDAEVSFTLVNNGREAWPEKFYLAPVDPDSSPTVALKSVLAEGWLAPDLVSEALPSLAPGTSGTITFKVKAPETDQTTTVLQYFNLHDDKGDWFGNNWLTGPGHRNMGVRVIVIPKDLPEVKLPMIETMEGDEPTLPWQTKFGQVKKADEGTTPTPDNAPVAHLHTPGHRFDTAWLGRPDMEDYRIEAWVYCELRKEQKKSGWERVGIFARDNGQHVADTKTEVEIGKSLAMAFDSDDGSVRAGDISNGGIGDSRDQRFRLQESGWHKFAIACKGRQVTYELDDKPFHVEQNVRGFSKGDCGVFYNSAFDPSLPESQRSHGIYFSGVKVTDE